jgi:S-adenosylmethionine:tRNA ribosyltransferase-isomerase
VDATRPARTLLGAPLDTLDFTLPPELEATEPPEARGLARDEVRLMVSYLTTGTVVHTRFRDLDHYLASGDLLVINTSGTINAALDVVDADGAPLELHLSTHLPGGQWTVEMRRPEGHASVPYPGARPGDLLRLPAGATACLLAPYRGGIAGVSGPAGAQPRVRGTPTLAPPTPATFMPGLPTSSAPSAATRLWVAALDLPLPWPAYLDHYGFPIHYGYVRERLPLAAYQTVYATEPGSAEMPSAGRAFTPELITRLVAKGVQVAPLLLHTGVSSLEEHEPPYEEYYRVPAATARLVDAARAEGRRVIAVGTTVVRALETVTDATGTHPGAGWTDVVVTPARGIHAVTSLLTGLHEPRASHLAMLEALAGRDHLRLAYAAALRERYLWHEFGDLHLMVP